MDFEVLGHFGNIFPWSTTFMFWVFSNSKWNYAKQWHEVWKKYKILTLENFYKCWKFWLFFDFSKFFDFLWSWWIIWSILMIEKVFFWKIWPKVKVWLFCADKISSDVSEIDWWSLWTSVMFWTQKLGQHVVSKICRSISNQKSYSLIRKSEIAPPRSKP